MKRDITPFYLETPYETLTGSGLVSPSGDTSFVVISGLTDNMNVALPIRNSNDKPIKPGTCIRFYRDDDSENTCTILLINVKEGSTEIITENNITFGQDEILKNGESCTVMMMGPSETNKQGEWAVIDSDLAGAGSWDGGTVSQITTFSANVNLNGGTNSIGNNLANLAQIKSSVAFANNNNNQPVITVLSADDGGASFVGRQTNNLGEIQFSGNWASGDTLTFEFTAAPYTAQAHSPIIFTEKEGTVNGSITTKNHQGFVFTATGPCSGTLKYLFLFTSQ